MARWGWSRCRSPFWAPPPARPQESSPLACPHWHSWSTPPRSHFCLLLSDAPPGRLHVTKLVLVTIAVLVSVFYYTIHHLTKSTQPIGLLHHRRFIGAIFGEFSLLFHSPFCWLSAEQQIANNCDLAHKVVSLFYDWLWQRTLTFFNSTEVLLACFLMMPTFKVRNDWQARTLWQTSVISGS